MFPKSNKGALRSVNHLVVLSLLVRERQFLEYQRLSTKLEDEGNYQEAIKVALFYLEKLPEKASRIRHWTALLYTKTGQYDSAVRILEDGLNEGLWWSNQAFSDFPEFDVLREREDFRRIVRRGEEAKSAVLAGPKPEMMVLPPARPESSVSPLLIAFHGRGANPTYIFPVLQPALAENIVLALPQSSQPLAANSFCWDEDIRAEKDAVDAYIHARTKYPTDPARIIVAGFSQGGDLAIRLALKQTFRSNGFIAVVPSCEFSNSPDLVDRAPTWIKGYILTGGEDEGVQGARELHQKMTKRGLSCELHIEEGIRHDLPGGFETIFSAAVSYVLGR